MGRIALDRQGLPAQNPQILSVARYGRLDDKTREIERRSQVRRRKNVRCRRENVRGAEGLRVEFEPALAGGVGRDEIDKHGPVGLGPLRGAEHDLRAYRAPAGKAPAEIPVAELHDVPRTTVRPRAGGVDLRAAVFVIAMPGKDGPFVAVEADLEGHVDETLLDGSRIDHFAASEGDGQFDRFAGGRFPIDEVAAAGVAKRMVGRAVGGVTPHPCEVEETVGSGEGVGRVGVAVALAVEQRAREQAAPGFGVGVVDVVEVAAAPAAAVAVAEDEIAGGILEEDGVSDFVFAVAGHAVDALEAGDIERPGGAVVNERVAVHVARQVDLPVAVHGQFEVIVAVPAGDVRIASALREGLALRMDFDPLVAAKSASGHHHAPVLVIVSHELVFAFREDAEADRVTGPRHVGKRGNLGRSHGGRVAQCTERGGSEAGPAGLHGWRSVRSTSMSGITRAYYAGRRLKAAHDGQFGVELMDACGHFVHDTLFRPERKDAVI